MVADSPPGTVVGTVTATDEDGDDLTYATDSTDFAVRADGVITVAGADLSTGRAVHGPRHGQRRDEPIPSPRPDDHVVGRRPRPELHRGALRLRRRRELAGRDRCGRYVARPTRTATPSPTRSPPATPAASSPIDPATGTITVAGALDFEAKDSFDLTVRATAGSHADAAVTVTVEDVNEAPVVGGHRRPGRDRGPAIEAIDVDVTDPDQGDTPRSRSPACPPASRTATADHRHAHRVRDLRGRVTATDTGGLVGATHVHARRRERQRRPGHRSDRRPEATEDEAIDPITVTATDEDGDDVALSVSALPPG